LTGEHAEERGNAHYFDEAEQVAAFTAGLVGNPTSKQQQSGAVFVVAPTVGAITLVKMPIKGESVFLPLQKFQ